MSPEISVYDVPPETCGRLYPDIFYAMTSRYRSSFFPSENFQNGGEFTRCVFADLALISSQAQPLLTYTLRYPDTCGRSYTIRLRYVLTQIFWYPVIRNAGYKQLRTRVDGTLACSRRSVNWAG